MKIQIHGEKEMIRKWNVDRKIFDYLKKRTWGKELTEQIRKYSQYIKQSKINTKSIFKLKSNSKKKKNLKYILEYFKIIYNIYYHAEEPWTRPYLETVEGKTGFQEIPALLPRPRLWY